MGTDRDGIGEMTEDECLALLTSNEVGRLAVVVDGHPLIFPVNYLLDARSIVVRTGVGTMLRGASFSQVAFEIDGFDTDSRGGWSVIVQGMAHDVTDAVDRTSEHVQTLKVLPWAPGSKPRLLRIDLRVITGRRFNGPLVMT